MGAKSPKKKKKPSSEKEKEIRNSRAEWMDVIK